MSGRALTGAAAAAVLVAIVVLALSGGAAYTVKVPLETANGLREGSDVKAGGVRTGKIVSLDVDRHDNVYAKLELDKGTRIGPGATARVVTSNLLGSKYIQLDEGDTRRPLPSGSSIPRDQVSYPVDLDQVVDVLDGDTRARLAVLIDEAGTGLTGRKADWNETLRLLAPTLDDLDDIVDAVARDNHSLADTVAHASAFVDRINAQRSDLTRLVNVAGATMRTTAEKRAQLMQTLAEAPGTLVAAQRFLGDLQATTVPLGPAARALEQTAPALTGTLAALPAFEVSARPALERATAVAPQLTRLADGATPVGRRAVPTLRTTARVLTTAKPVTNVLRYSVDDALGLLEGWARAIQTRDGLSHVFRGRAVLPVDTFDNAIDKLVNTLPAARRQRALNRERQRQHTGNAPAPAVTPAPSHQIVPGLGDILGLLPSDAGRPVQDTLDKVQGDAVTPLLDFLLKP